MSHARARPIRLQRSPWIWRPGSPPPMAISAVREYLSSETFAIGSYIDSWVPLSLAHRTRLKARLKRLITSPPPLSSLKKRLEPLSPDARRAIASFLAHLAHADGYVDPAEVKLLERIYAALGIDVQVLYSDLHVGNVGGAKNPT